MPMIKVTCPNPACRTEGQVDDSRVGTSVTCQRCKTSFVVQAPSPIPSASGTYPGSPGDPESMVTQFLRNLGLNAVFQVVNPMCKYALLNYCGLNLVIQMDQNQFIQFNAGIGFVPKANLVALYRRLLELNSTSINWWFAIEPTQDNVQIRSSRPIQGIDFAEFKAILDVLVGAFFQQGAPIQQQFQLSAVKM